MKKHLQTKSNLFPIPSPQRSVLELLRIGQTQLMAQKVVFAGSAATPSAHVLISPFDRNYS